MTTKKEKDQELEELEALINEEVEKFDKAIEPEVLDEEPEQTKEQKALDKAKKRLTRKVDDFTTAKSKQQALEKAKTFDSKLEHSQFNNGGVSRPTKIVPEIEQILFPFYVAGASVRSIWQQFGDKFGFSLRSLYSARDFYLWEDRRKVIQNSVMLEKSVDLQDRMGDYMKFFDDMISEAIIRFSQNAVKGNMNNPYNNLKVTNVKDLTDLVKMMMEIQNGGAKGGRPISSDSVKGTPTITDKRASALLEILAKDDEDFDEDDEEA